MKTSAAILIAALLSSNLWAQDFKVKFPTINELPIIEELPDPFTFYNSDKKVVDSQDWEKRRAELKELFQHYVYGQLPPLETNATGEIISSTKLYGGKATHYKARVKLAGGAINATVSWIVPEGKGPFPLIIDTIYKPEIDKKKCVETVVERGYAVAEWYLYEFEPRSSSEVGQVQNAFPNMDSGIVAQWAWSASAVCDFFRKQDRIDPAKMIITGNSKRGKTVLLAAAMDDRIPAVAPCCSGIGGMGVYRFNPDHQGAYLGNDLSTPVKRQLYSKNLQMFIDQETKLPTDQHLLAALVAPRPILMINGKKDAYDRNVQVQAGYCGAKPVFEWLGVPQNIGYWLHPEGHGYIEPGDWYATVDFCQMVWFGKAPEDGKRFDKLGYPEKKLFSWTAPGKTVSVDKSASAAKAK